MINNLKKAFQLLPSKMNTAPAAQEVMSICAQETDLIHRRQMGNGPARGLAQFEKGDEKSRAGVYGVMNHPASRELVRHVCHERGVPFERDVIWKALEFDDVLAFALARLLLWTDSGKLPTTQQEGWDTYLRVWRPGKPHPEKWATSWRMAKEVLDGR